MVIIPDQPPAAPIQRIDCLGLGEVHHSAHYDGHTLKVVGAGHVEHPFVHQRAYIRKLDLIQLAVRLAVVTAVIVEPITARRLLQLFARDLRGE